MPKNNENIIRTIGSVIACQRNLIYRVTLDEFEGREIDTYLGGRMRQAGVVPRLFDKVTIELDKQLPDKGRIVYLNK